MFMAIGGGQFLRKLIPPSKWPYFAFKNVPFSSS
jgi:hypothetical protein